ncbi:pantoate--beta-alanine ligase [Paenibacillus contaminans]|uniref:Pantothenate synthetase n=1 Tax=Paenibacillus contaminans TaxID=450362 RepID=A0A329MET1_9BACL|nr:pantoate--beta-alanine ligase [Paenibacillus contaminans]RAV18489.1 pantoate--beta-alanine ligase [Paenibacillus contaminans]
MEVVTTIEELRAALDLRRGKPLGSNKTGKIGFVPTMGFLHDGHASLMERAKRECDTVVLSIFVNPLQFGPNEDFDRYPRDEERDKAIARREGVDFIFMPDVQTMYPQRIRTTVSVSGVTEKLCGASRPGHFDGVATVVSKLFNIVQPDRAYFGMKDAQQVAVVEQMTKDLNMRVTIVPCPTLREADGLAMSSRNVYLSADERKQALVLSQALGFAEKWSAEAGEDSESVIRRVRNHIESAPSAVIDYVELLSYPSLTSTQEWSEAGITDDRMVLALAVKFGKTRLIDNRILPINKAWMNKAEEAGACSGR